MLLFLPLAVPTLFACEEPHGPPPRSATGAGVHAVAYISDSLSHGLPGDGLLSLNEAIQLHNGTLPYAALSPAEQIQLSLIPGTGSTTDVTWIDIDGTSTPIITIERDLDPIAETTFGMLIKGFNEPPVLDFSGPNLTHGFRCPTDDVKFEDLILLGGPYGIDVQQDDVAGQSGLTVRDVVFDGQGQFGVRVQTATANGIGRFVMDGCEFLGVPQAVVWNETPAGRTTLFELTNTRITGAFIGLEVALGPSGTGVYRLDRLVVDASLRGLWLHRPPGAGRTILVESTHVETRAQECVRIEGAATGATALTLRMHRARALSGGNALMLGTPGANVYGELDELVLDGRVELFTGGGTLPLAATNLRLSNGQVLLSGSTTQPVQLADTRFDGCQVMNTGAGAVACTGCCVLGGSLLAVFAPFVCTSSFVQATVGANVQQIQPLPQAQLGNLEIVPATVAIGGPVGWQPDLPPGLVGFCTLGFTDPAPVLQPPPLHVYSTLASTLVMPGLYRLQQSYSFTIPNYPILRGIDLTAQLLVLPDPTMQAPWVNLPPGRRFALR
jgi:hypothetical protein